MDEQQQQQQQPSLCSDASSSATTHTLLQQPSSVVLQKNSIVGGAVTCVAFWNTQEHVIVILARGPNLEFTCLQQQHDFDDDELKKSSSSFSYRPFVFGGSIHGIKTTRCAEDETTTRTSSANTAAAAAANTQSRILAVAFGARKLSMFYIQEQKENDDATPPVRLSFEPMHFQKVRSSSSVGATRSKSQSTASTTLEVPDWIWDVSLNTNNKKNSTSDNNNNHEITLWIAMAHNVVEEWCIAMMEGSNKNNVNEIWRASRHRKFVCCTRCITYSMYLHNSPKQLNRIMVVSGTVMNELLIWNVGDAAASTASRTDANNKQDDDMSSTSTTVTSLKCHVNQVLKGHEGVIHSVKVSTDGEYIASTSDDRTVRVWKKDNTNYVLCWTGWNGHLSRIWNCTFCCYGKMLVTAGEDGIASCWDLESGQLVDKLRGGHAQKSIWTVAAVSNTDESIVVTGGNNGVVRVWNLSRRRLVNGVDSNSDVTTTTIEENTSQQQKRGTQHRTVRVPRDGVPPDDGPVAANSTASTMSEDGNDAVLQSSMTHESCVTPNAEDTPKKKKKKKKKQAGQVVFGFQFYYESDSHDGCYNKLLVATRQGSLFSYCLSSNQWTRLEPWWTKADTSLPYSCTDGSCLAVRTCGRLVAIGTTTGHVVLLPIQELQDGKAKSSSGMLDDANNRSVAVASCRQHGKSVQGIDWIDDDTTLISLHIKGIIIFWKKALPSSEHNSSMVLHRVLDMDTVGIPMSCARFGSDLLFVGDSRGNIASFCLLGDDSDDSSLEVLPPTNIVPRAHKKEHVTDMVVLQDKNLLLSVGNDGCLNQYMVDASSGKLCRALSLPTASFTGISRIYSQNRKLLVGGYYGNEFAIVEVATGTELFRVNTGGRQRGLDCYVAMQRGKPLSYGVAVCASLKEGGNEVILQYSLDHPQAQQKVQYLERSIGIGLHGETIYDACFCSTPNGSLFVLSGSEDCTTRLSRYKDGTLTHSIPLQPHESCVRAVCSSEGTHSTLLVTCGGKLIMQFFVLVHDHQDGSGDDDRFPVWFLCDGRFPTKPTIDHRINAVQAIGLEKPSDEGATDSHLVITGDSNGAISLFVVHVGVAVERQSSNTGHVLYRASRPILSLHILPVGSRLLLLAGTTGGDVLAFNLPRNTSATNLAEVASCCQTPIATYKAHGMGTNSISATIVDTNDDKKCHNILICSGGDDQAVTMCKSRCCCTDSDSSTFSMDIIDTFVTPEASASAIKGVHVVGRDMVLSVGYSQRLALWKMGNNGILELVTRVAVDVSDVNCLTVCSCRQQDQQETTSGGVVAAVAGEGLEFFELCNSTVTPCWT